MLYSGPLGLAVYAYSERSSIAHDSLWRRGFRSVAHPVNVLLVHRGVKEGMQNPRQAAAA